MNDEVIPLLKVHEYFKDASDETLDEVVRLGRVAQYPAGSVVHEADVVLTTVGFVCAGGSRPSGSAQTVLSRCSA